VDYIYINVNKYDFHLARICLASLRYWYPEVPVRFIKDYSQGNFDTSHAGKVWNAEVLALHRKKLGWGFGKLETLFLPGSYSFLVLDADTVITGKVLDMVKDIKTSFILDDEIPEVKRFNEVYYNLDRINELAPEFKFPGYSFNSGQWFGTSGIINRTEFDPILTWSEPPEIKFPEILFNGDQGLLNYVIHRKVQDGQLQVTRKKMMIWPKDGNADIIDLEKIRLKTSEQPFIIHWAGMKSRTLSGLPRMDILRFYRDYYYTRMPIYSRLVDAIRDNILFYKKKADHFFNTRVKSSLKESGFLNFSESK